MFPALRQLFRTVYKVLNRDVRMFFTDDLMSSASGGALSGEYAGSSMAEMPFPVKS
jgi:hypothetical protein